MTNTKFFGLPYKTQVTIINNLIIIFNKAHRMPCNVSDKQVVEYLIHELLVGSHHNLIDGTTLPSDALLHKLTSKGFKHSLQKNPFTLMAWVEEVYMNLHAVKSQLEQTRHVYKALVKDF